MARTESCNFPGTGNCRRSITDDVRLLSSSHPAGSAGALALKTFCGFSVTESVMHS